MNLDDVKTYGKIAALSLAIYAGVDLTARAAKAYTYTGPNRIHRSQISGIIPLQVQYSKLPDGSQEVRIQRVTTTLLQDFDGDNHVDRIRKDGYFSRIEILVRTHDYESHKHEFDDADAKLLAESKRK